MCLGRGALNIEERGKLWALYRLLKMGTTGCCLTFHFVRTGLGLIKEGAQKRQGGGGIFSAVVLFQGGELGVVWSICDEHKLLA